MREPDGLPDAVRDTVPLGESDTPLALAVRDGEPVGEKLKLLVDDAE